MKENYSQIEWLLQVTKSPLFVGLSEEESGRLLRGRVTLSSFKKGEIIYDARHLRSSLGFLLKGRAQALKPLDGGEAVLLNELVPPAVFGAAGVFSAGAPYVTVIRAKTDCQVCFLPETELEVILRENFLVAKNYIMFLTSRVNFLNRKIECFTLGTAEERLCLYLRENKQKEAGIYVASIPGPTQLSSMLGVSRASLYRAIDQLAAKGLIEKTGRQIVILQPKRLEAFSER